MASTIEDNKAPCLMCFETRPLKIVGKCKHSFCVECLSTVLESLDSESEVFPCPTCKADCPRPWDGVKGLVDQGGNTKELTVTLKPAETPKKEVAEETVELKCQICIRKKIDVEAVSYCAKCGHFYFCQHCDEAHARNKATKSHAVTYLQPSHDVCTTHDADLASYCKTCNKAVCTVCVMLDHGDHDVEDLEEIIDEQANKVKSQLVKQESNLTEMQNLEKELTSLNDLVPQEDRQDVLIKDIEDHVEKYVDQVIKWKEDFKKKIKSDFKIIRDIPQSLEKVTSTVRILNDAVDGARKLLSMSEHRPVYLDRLLKLETDLNNMGTARDEMEGREFRKELIELQRQCYRFKPCIIPSNYGSLVTSEFSRNLSEIFTHKLQLDSEDKFIPCIANLGSKFAVAHPTNRGEFSDAIDIYNVEGTLINTLTDQVAPVYDMSATPDGKLAVLSDGSGGTGRCVKVFDPEEGYMRSTKDIQVYRPLSLGVTQENKFVILGEINDFGKKKIFLTDKDGEEKDTYLISHEREAKFAHTLKCAANLIFVMGRRYVKTFEIKETGINKLEDVHVLATDYTLSDISATFCDEFVVVYVYCDDLKCGFLRLLEESQPESQPEHDTDDESSDTDTNTAESETELTWQWEDPAHIIAEDLRGVDRNVKISASHSHVLVSHGHTFKVFHMKLCS